MKKLQALHHPSSKASDITLSFPISLDTHINTYDTQIYSVLIHKDNYTYLQHVYSTDINVISNFLFQIMLQAHIWDTIVPGSTSYRWACQLLKHLKINITSFSELQTHRTFIGLVKCFDLVCVCVHVWLETHVCGRIYMHACVHMCAEIYIPIPQQELSLHQCRCLFFFFNIVLTVFSKAHLYCSLS